MGIVAKYKFDGSVYADLIPEFNAEFTDYTITDEVEGNIITRTIESDSLPTLMRFGVTPEDSGNGTEREKSLMEIIELDTSNLTNASSMFRTCSNLSILHDINTWNVSNVINMASMFGGGCGITSLDLSNWDTSKVITFDSMFSNDRLLTTLKLFKIHSSCVNMYNMFLNCENIIALDLSSWDTESIEYYNAIFKGMFKLSSLDISNFSIKSTANVSDMFTSTLSLTDIGMIYCNKETVNKVASLLPTDHNITIWVESDDILQYDQYDHITYKTQKVQDTVHLNSPLLMGDTIEVIDGKTYHVHRYWKHDFNTMSNGGFRVSVIDTSDYIRFYKSIEGLNFPLKPKNNGNIICDYLYADSYTSLETRKNEGIAIKSDGVDLNINLHKSRGITSYQQFITWVQSQNPFIYELATPYYELISEEPLELTLLDTTDNTINNNSILPSNMTIANKELSIIAIKPSTTYTLSFDKSIEDSEVTIDICGGEQITTVLNRVELTTPSELGSGIRFISSDGCIISNVRLLEGSLVEEAIPKETFEGLKSSFEDGYIIGENIIGELYNLHDWKEVGNNYVANTTKNTIRQSNLFISLPKKLKNNQQYTVFVKMTDYTQGLCFVSLRNNDNTALLSAEYNIGSVGMHSLLFTTTGEATGIRFLTEAQKDNSYAINKDIIILEGDHTHLSEAELMRYIEKGTSHYEEEDYNHVGKYKVQYKVTGKNKAGDITPAKGNANDNHWIVTDNNNGTFTVKNDGYTGTSEGFALKLHANVKPNTTYTFTYKVDGVDWNEGSPIFIYRDFYSLWDKTKFIIASRQTNTIAFTTPSDVDKICIGFHYSMLSDVTERIISNIQLEEGTVATEYEPYKEDIKTYYLSSPLLEGDTIEDINGVATHVRRYGRVVLDGSKNWAKESVLENTVRYALNNTVHNFMQGTGHNNIKAFSNYNIGRYSYNNTDYIHFHFENSKLNFFMDIKYENMTTFKSILNENPLIVVAKLFSPIYEPISTESILLDSYTNGHLDLNNENIPIQKTEFRNFTKELAYLQPSTDYVVRFSSDDIGIAKVYLDSSVKEINVVKGINEVIITTPSTIVNNNIIIDGIGFNVSDVQVVANAIKDGDIKDFDYFKGLQSSFEDGLVTDETDENYGKYKVECKIVGKNKFNGELINGSINNDSGELSLSTIAMDSVVSANPIKVKSDTTYCISNDLNYSNYIYEYDFNMNYLNHYKFINTSSFTTLYNTCYVRVRSVGSKIENDLSVKYQLEEGTQATSYEPYKESIHTLYLNSPLLKGDKLVVHDGKLCHYHKMGMVVLDGSEDERWNKIDREDNYFLAYHGINDEINYPKLSSIVMCDKIRPHNTSISNNTKGFVIGTHNTTKGVIRIVFPNDKLNGLYDVSTVRQWLQQNPTTVVYELAEPYYEPIEPQLSQYSFSTVKDGDMDIITVLPIEKVNLTYRTDINGVSSIEEQIASIQESTDISSIIDEEVDE